MKHNIHENLGFEIKKEIADQYFGFRKLIEEDKLDLTEKIQQHSFILEKRISFDLIRIYILFKNEDVIHDFLKLIGLDENLFYDPHLTKSPTIKQRVFDGQQLRGLTKATRFKNLILDCYERLTSHVRLYSQKFAELQELQDTISSEIELFHRKHDLGTIMGFLHSISEPSINSTMQGGMETGMAADLAKKMRIEAPPPIEQFLPAIPLLPDISSIKKPLMKLIKLTYQIHGKQFLATCDLERKRRHR